MHIGGKDESVSALESNPAIGNELLRKIKKWYSEGATTDDVIERLRLQIVPPGYSFHNWTEGVI